MTTFSTDLVPPKYASNPIINIGGAAWYAEQVFDPNVFVDPADGTKLILFCSGMAAPAQTGEISIGRFTATVANPFSWTEFGQVLTKAAGQWDDTSVRLGSLIYDAGTWNLYYTGGTPGSTSIGLATSANGTSFSRSGSNPILTPTGQGRNDGTSVSEAAVLKEGSAWTMLYSYRTATKTLPGLRYATSADGIAWTKGGSGDILNVEPLFVEFHQILKIDGQYYVIYEAGNGSYGWKCYAASSSVVTGPFSAEMLRQPILNKGAAAAWDQYHVATPFLLGDGTDYRLYYSGAGDHDQPYYTNTWPLGVATYPRATGGFFAMHGAGGRR